MMGIIPSYAISLAMPITRPALASRKYRSKGNLLAKAVPPNIVMQSCVTLVPASEHATFA